MKRVLVLLLLATVLMGVSRCSSVNIDPIKPVAAAANDATLIIEAGGETHVGYAYVRVLEGSAAKDQFVSIVLPASECSDDSCAEVTIFYPDGSTPKTLKIPAKEHRLKIFWTDILKRETFEKDDRGFWPIVATWKWKGPDGKQYQTEVEGEIRLRVMAKGYVPLHLAYGSNQFAWVWSDGPLNYGYSTAGRASVGDNMTPAEIAAIVMAGFKLLFLFIGEGLQYRDERRKADADYKLRQEDFEKIHIRVVERIRQKAPAEHTGAINVEDQIDNRRNRNNGSVPSETIRS